MRRHPQSTRAAGAVAGRSLQAVRRRPRTEPPIRFLLAATFALLALPACGPSAPPRAEEDAPAVAEGSHAPRDSHAGEAGGHDGDVVVLSPEKLAAADLATARAELRPLSPQLETTGEVGYEQDRLAHVSPRIPGRVLRVPASLGDEVEAGEVLAVLDSVELGEARARYLAARGREVVARESWERERRLYEDRISSEKEMLEARAAFLEAEATRQGAEETLRLYGLGAEQIRDLQPGQAGASTLPVRAPLAGRVVEKHVTVGELVTPADNLFTLADLGHVWIWIDVFERDLERVHEGDAVAVGVDALPGRVFEGEVTYLGAEVAAETRAVRARIDVANPERLLRPGMFATVRLTDPHATAGRDSLVVPRGAVVTAGGAARVFLPAGEGRFEARSVEVGRREGEWVEVLAGLEPGDVVVTDGTFLLKSELAREELGGGHGH